MSTLKRILPALILLIISPLVAEFLLGDFNIQQLKYLGIFIPLYGASALFIREIVRRTGRGWGTIILLGVVFGLVAEGLVNLTLFNPNYAGAKLLEYGFIPKLGTSFNYAVFIITLHTVWSISTPIAIVEGIAGKRAKEPWLRTPELMFVGVLSILGLVGTAISTIKRFHFEASIAQYLSIIILILLIILVAFKVVKPVKKHSIVNQPKNAPSISVVLISAFVLSSAFQQWFHYAPSHHINSKLGLIVFLALDVLAIILFSFWSRKSHWQTKHIIASAMGALLTYNWFGLQRLVIDGHTAMGVKTESVDIIGQVALIIILLGLCIYGIKKQRNE